MSTPIDLGIPRVADFGPDHTKTDPKPNFEEPKARKANGLSLGDNAKPRSGVRQLRDSDREWIADKYKTIGRFAKPFHANFAEAMELQSDICADAWMNVAAKNDKVRRQILAAIEGGAWGELMIAHSPIVMALLPERFLNRMLDRSMELFGAFLNRTSDEGEQQA